MSGRGGGGRGGRGGYQGGGGGRGGGYQGGGGGRGGGGGGRGGGGGYQGGRGGGGGGGYQGGRGGGFGGGGGDQGRRPQQPADIWSCPNLSAQNSPKLPALPAVNKNLSATPALVLQKPKAPGQVAAARYDCITNYYELTLGKKAQVAYFYSVKISKRDRPPRAAGGSGKKDDKKGTKPVPDNQGPATGPRKERKLGMRINRKIFGEIPRAELGNQTMAYDGRLRACGMKRIANDGLFIVVDYDGDRWEVTLTYEKAVEISSLKPGQDFGKSENVDESLLALAIMLNHQPSLSYTPLGRGFYGLPGETPKIIGGGFELWTGYKAHILPGESKLFLNLNYAITAFVRPGEVIHNLPQLIEARDEHTVPASLNPGQIQMLNKKLSRCKAEVTHLKTRKPITIQCITREPANKIYFNDRDGRRVSVADYFGSSYFKLKYPSLPCVQVGTEKPRHFPLEVVTILRGNPYRGEQTPQLVSDIIRKAAIQPRNRLEEIRFAAKTLRAQREIRDEFDMDIKVEETVVPARILPTPKLVAGGKRAVQVNPGVIDFRSNQFARGSNIDRWTVVNTDERLDWNMVDQFVNTFMAQAKQTGVILKAPLEEADGSLPMISDRTNITQFEQQIEKLVTKNNLQFVLFVLSDNSPVHASVKFTCDVKLGVASKCVKGSTVRKVTTNSRPGPDQCLLNILYGLNPKFNGENVVGINTEFAFQMLSSSATLIIGLDVNHGQAKVREGHPKMPSTVGIVGTRNANATLYTAFMRAQRKPANSADREVIQASLIKPAVHDILVNFFKNERKKPERIIVYRDGVSNGQFTAVLANEMNAIIEACAEMPGKDRYRPPITFVTVQKRHDSRLFPSKVTTDRQGREKQNPIPGTVVDSVLFSDRVWSFLLCSHEGIQGTSKPALYTVLFDENGFSNDQLQSLTYYLCHLYGKCPRAVSIPSPTYYAHYVAFRAAEIGAHYWHNTPEFKEWDTRSFSSGSSDGRALEEQEKVVLKAYNESTQVKETFATSMYFL